MTVSPLTDAIWGRGVITICFISEGDLVQKYLPITTSWSFHYETQHEIMTNWLVPICIRFVWVVLSQFGNVFLAKVTQYIDICS